MATELDRRGEWGKHWSRLGSVARARSSFLSGGRKIVARSLAAMTERHFPPSGTFLHAGSGSAESDALIRKHRRSFIALDFVLAAAAAARRLPNGYLCLVGDLKRLPLRDDCLDGIWNLGVHEHFPPAENRRAFQEFVRALKPGGKALIFWPARFTPYMLLKDAAELVIGLFKPGFRFFPDEINKARSRAHVRRELEGAGLRVLSVSLSWADLFVYYTAVAEKPAGRGARP